MNKFNFLLSAVCLLGISAIANASIQTDCIPPDNIQTAHSIFVCPEIEKARTEWREYQPPEPFFEKTLQNYDVGTINFPDYSPDQGTSGGGGAANIFGTVTW